MANDNINEDTTENFFDFASRTINKSINDVPKNIIIHGYENVEKNNINRLNILWNMIEIDMKNILNDNKRNSALLDLYNYVEELCDLECYKLLYDNLKELLTSHVMHQFQQIINDINDKEGLTNINVFWVNYQKHIDLICKVFLHFDRTYLLENTSLGILRNHAFNIVSTAIQHFPNLICNIYEQILNLIQSLRQQSSSSSDLQHVIQPIRMLIDLNFYSPSFENLFIERTKEYYSTYSDKLVLLPIEEYIDKIIPLINLEENVISTVISKSTSHKLLQTVRYELFTRHFQLNLRKGLFTLIDENKNHYLNLINNLALNSKGGEENLIANLVYYAKTHVIEIMALSTTINDYEIKVIEKLIELHNRLTNEILIIFNDNNISKNVINSFNNTVNSKSSKFIDLFCVYLHKKIIELQDISETEFHQFVKRFLPLLKCISKKDSFISKYRINLAERLLDPKLTNIDCEKAILDQIKIDMGSDAVKNIETMINDIDLSKEISKDFNNQFVTSYQFCSSLLVLSKGKWPEHVKYNINVPPQIHSRMSEYTTFYKSKFGAIRNLSFPLFLGRCILAVQFINGEKELDLDFLQAMILEQFIYKDIFTVDEITTNLMAKDIEDIELYPAILSLSSGNHTILCKNPPGLKILPNHTLTFNYSFNHQLYRIRVPRFAVVKRPSEQIFIEPPENSHTCSLIDSLTVSTLKKHKTLTSDQIVKNVLENHKFPLKEELIRSRLSSLVNRDYIKVSAEDPDVYSYNPE